MMSTENLENMETKNVTKTKKNRYIGRIVLIALATLVAIALFIMLGMVLHSNQQLLEQAKMDQSSNQKIEKYIDDELIRQAEEAAVENEYEEDGYFIGSTYEIRSTKAISDAYISGDDSALSETEKETLQMATEILEEIITDGMSVFEKEKAVYDWMYEHIGQGNSSVVTLPGAAGDDFTPYGVLRERNAVCVGYATTFRMFAHMLGLECHVVHNEYHSWDLVQLEDGEWYHLDIYSDVASRIRYRNFNMTDAQASTGHDWDGSALPEAKGTKYSYASQCHEVIKDIYAMPARVKQAIDNNESTIFCAFETKLTEEELPIADVLVSQMQSIMYGCLLPGYDSYDISGSWFENDEVGYILGIYISNYNNNVQANDSSVEKEDSEKMTQTINEVFGVSLEDITPDDVIPEEEMPEEEIPEESEPVIDDVIIDDNVSSGQNGGIAKDEVGEQLVTDGEVAGENEAVEE